MAGLITVADLLDNPGFDGLNTSHAQALINNASAYARLAARGALDDVQSPDTPEAVVAILIDMIRRGWQNPMGHGQEGLGDYSYSNPAPASLHPTKRERRDIRQAVGVLGAGSITMTGDLPGQPSDRFYGSASESLLGS